MILGGGLAGLTLCRTLAARHPRATFLIVEKEAELGGLSRSYALDDVLFDFGPHVLRDRDGEVLRRLDRSVELLPYRSRPVTYKQGRFFDHVIPIIPEANIARLPPEVQTKVRVELEQVAPPGAPGPSPDFQAHLESRIGPTLTWEFFGQYSKKWWGLDPHQLSAELAPREVRVGELATYGHITTSFAPPAHEYYPERGGYGSLVDALWRSVRSRVGPRLHLRTRTRVASLLQEGTRVAEVGFAGDGAVRVGQDVVSTLPLPHLGAFLGLEVPLRYRANVCVMLTAPRGRTRALEGSWVYFPDPEVAFARLSSPGAFSPQNEPGDRRGFCAELPCQEGDEVWRSDDARLVERVEDDLRRLGYLGPGAPTHAMVRREASAYPILDLHAAPARRRAMAELRSRAENLRPVGRTGGFLYWNADAVLTRSDEAC